MAPGVQSGVKAHPHRPVGAWPARIRPASPRCRGRGGRAPLPRTRARRGRWTRAPGSPTPVRIHEHEARLRTGPWCDDPERVAGVRVTVHDDAPVEIECCGATFGERQRLAHDPLRARPAKALPQPLDHLAQGQGLLLRRIDRQPRGAGHPPGTAEHGAQRLDLPRRRKSELIHRGRPDGEGPLPLQSADEVRQFGQPPLAGASEAMGLLAYEGLDLDFWSGHRVDAHVVAIQPSPHEQNR